MSVYAYAIQSGVESLAKFANLEGTAEYATAYNNAAKRFRMASAKSAAEKNISAVRQDKILTNTKIQLQASQAEALQRVQNAAGDREGQSADTVIGEVHKTAAQMAQANEKSSRQQEESLLAQINESQTSLLSVRDPKNSFASGMIEAFSSLEFSDLKLTKDLGAMMGNKKAASKGKGK